MKVLILEDEKSSALRLERMLSKYDETKIFKLYFAETLTEAISQIEKEKFELLFLDLNLKNEDGFDILKSFVSEPFYTIIISAYFERAIEAFEYGVIDFISKPLFQERLNKALERFFSFSRFNSSTKFLFVKNGNKLESISMNNIMYFQPAGHYSEIILDDGKKKLHNLSLDKIIKILPNNFERIHRSYIVNLNFLKNINSYQGSKYEIELDQQIKLPMGRSFAKKIKSLFNQS
ncbi:MAG: LytTR family DNA-binding domain-containing protein [Candidatus Lokiarchaeia archaeon]